MKKFIPLFEEFLNENIGSLSYQQFCKEIEKTKKKLQKTKVKENFGQIEVDRLIDLLHDKVGYPNITNRNFYNALDAFDEWCMTYNGLSESRIADAMLDLVEKYYKNKDIKLIPEITDIFGLNPKNKKDITRVQEVLDKNDNPYDAFDELMQLQESRVNEAYSTDWIQPGVTMEIGGMNTTSFNTMCVYTDAGENNYEVVSIDDKQNEIVWKITVKNLATGRCYQAINNGHMFIISKEVKCN